MKAFLKGACIQDGDMQPFPLPLGSISSAGDGGFKGEGILTLSIHPGVVAFGPGIIWEVSPRLYARGSHALNVEFFNNISYFAWVSFHFPCAG
eukprot:769536-Pelagomonas_calceolata.AAC.1